MTTEGLLATWAGGGEGFGLLAAGMVALRRVCWSEITS